MNIDIRKQNKKNISPFTLVGLIRFPFPTLQEFFLIFVETFSFDWSLFLDYTALVLSQMDFQLILFFKRNATSFTTRWKSMSPIEMLSDALLVHRSHQTSPCELTSTCE
jgi:hypothetical protein